MSKDQNKNTDASQEKVMTKYDRKMQRRQEEKERAAREKAIGTGILVVVLVALVCFVLSFPIRSFITVNREFINVGGEKVTQVEFDYSYYTVVNNYINTYSQYLSYFGLDTSKDLSAQTYSGEMTWQDYFQEMTVDSIQRSKSLKADGQAAGFVHDTGVEYERFVTQQKEAAKAAGVNLNTYLKQAFGPYASLKRIQPYVEEALYVAAYYDKLSEDMTPTADAIEAAYAENPASYDSVDYRIQQFEAELPTEPTDLADPDAEPASEDQAYEPSEAEVKKAMADAKALADAALASIRTKGDLIERIQRSSTNSVIRDWLFDDSRKAGDTEVLEDTSNNRYYCIAFEKRYRDETPTADVRVMMAQDEEEALGIYGTWNSGAKTEESFTELCNGEYYDYAVAEGGLIEGIASTEDMYEELMDWIFAEGRAEGDCEVITIPDTASFVVYYVGQGQPEWYNTIESSLRSETLGEYVDTVQEKCEVKDPSENLNYLKIRAAQEAAAQEAQESAANEGESEAGEGESDSAAAEGESASE